MILSVLPLAIGWPQIVIILIVAVIIFGPVGIGKKLGNLIKGTGKGVKEFKKADQFIGITHKFDWAVIRQIDAANEVSYDCK